MTMPLSNILQPPNQATSTQEQPTSSPTQVFDGPITRSRAKKLQQEVHTLLYEFQLYTNGQETVGVLPAWRIYCVCRE